MTDDVTRGLGMLADDAEAAPIDTDAVIGTAMARTRRRAILATAFVTILLVSALVLAVGAIKPDQPRTADAKPGPPVLPTMAMDPPTSEDLARHRVELHNQITTGFARILPSGWQHSTFDFDCNDYHCWAEGDILDSGGTVKLSFSVRGDYSWSNCVKPTCTVRLLDDGTLVAFTKNDDSTSPYTNEPSAYRSISALRHDGTTISLSAWWPTNRTAPSLTDNQWIEFATVFNF